MTSVAFVEARPVAYWPGQKVLTEVNMSANSGKGNRVSGLEGGLFPGKEGHALVPFGVDGGGSPARE